VAAAVHRRSSDWRKLRNAYKEQNPVCIACGSEKKIEIHHIVPFGEDRTKEMDWENLSTFCKRHHFSIGHMMSYKKYNPDAVELAAIYRAYFNNRKIIDGDPDT